ncbi:MAG TPA: hypothetical protein VL326_20010 [Kofleriaceae bacterium]|jgi:hypothetical protein|nr:hypothetical protein [Kofleriaceae bacterium]
MVRPPFGAVLALTAISVAAALHDDPVDPIAQDWIAAAPHADYIETVKMHGDYTVDLVRRDGQVVRCEYHGRWRRSGGDYLRFEYVTEDGKLEVRDLDFSVYHGDFEIIDHDTGKTRHFACRIGFEASPFPSHCGAQSVYYGCPH